MQVGWIGGAIGPDDAAIGVGEGMTFLRQAAAIDTHEAKAPGVFTEVGEMDVKVNPSALLVCLFAGNLRCQRR